MSADKSHGFRKTTLTPSTPISGLRTATGPAPSPRMDTPQPLVSLVSAITRDAPRPFAIAIATAPHSSQGSQIARHGPHRTLRCRRLPPLQLRGSLPRCAFPRLCFAFRASVTCLCFLMNVFIAMLLLFVVALVRV
jgi:hypothetical protein